MRRICNAAVLIVLTGVLATAGSAFAAGATNVCIPSKEGKAIVTPKAGLCKTGYTLTELGAEGKEGKEGKQGAEGKQGPEGKNALSTSELETLKAVLPHIKYVASGIDGKPTIQLSGVNLQVVSGAGKEIEVDGEGNLIIGYDETPRIQTGSNNLVLGGEQEYTSFGGILGGYENAITGDYGVAFGFENVIEGTEDAVTGGTSNDAGGFQTSISGGESNFVESRETSVSGGFDNVATQKYASVTGGDRNGATGELSSVSGGESNDASGTASSITGGVENRATNNDAVVSGGYENKAEGADSAILGGKGHTLTTTYGAEL